MVGTQNPASNREHRRDTRQQPRGVRRRRSSSYMVGDLCCRWLFTRISTPRMVNVPFAYLPSQKNYASKLLTTMPRKISWLAGVVLVLLQTAVNPPRASAANVMNYGSGGNDYYQFTAPSMAFIKASGFTTLIPFAMHLNPDGTLLIGGDVACTNGLYTGPT